MSDRSVTLCSSEQFNRITLNSPTGPDTYRDGFRFFAGLLGYNNLKSYMNSFCQINMNNFVTTEQLEKYLIEKSAKKEIANYFRRFVYGIHV